MSEIAEWKELVAKAKQNFAKEQGRLETYMKQLKEEYEHETVEDLEKEIAELKQDISVKEQTLERLKEEFRHEHLERLRAAAQ